MAYPSLPDLGNTRDDYSRMTVGSTLTRKPRVLRAGFGNGYEQRTGDGINCDVRTFSARFDNMEPADCDKLDKFLGDRKGYLPFFASVPGHGQILFTCADWSRTYNATQDSLSATFVECFDP